MTRNHLFSVVVSMMMMCGSNVSECERVRSGEKNFLSDSTQFQQDSSQEMSALDDQDVLSGDQEGNEGRHSEASSDSPSSNPDDPRTERSETHNSLWFDSRGLSLLPEDHIYNMFHVSSGVPVSLSTGVNIHNTSERGSRSSPRLQSIAAMNVSGTTGGQGVRTYLMKLIQLICTSTTMPEIQEDGTYSLDTGGAPVGLFNHLVREPNMFGEMFLAAEPLAMLDRVAGHLGVSMPSPETWGRKSSGLQFILKVLARYHVDVAEAAAVDNLFSDSTEETRQNKIKFEAITSVLVTAGFSGTEILDPEEHGESLHVVRSFFNTVLYLETCLEQSRQEKFNLREAKRAISDYFDDAASRIAHDFTWDGWKEEVTLLEGRAKSLEDMFEKSMRKLVYGWAAVQRELFSVVPGDEKDKALWVLGNVFKIELVTPGVLQGDSLFNADNHDFAITILPASEGGSLTEAYNLAFKPIKAVVDMVDGKTEELKAAAEETAAAPREDFQTPTVVDTEAENRRPASRTSISSGGSRGHQSFNAASAYSQGILNASHQSTPQITAGASGVRRTQVTFPALDETVISAPAPGPGQTRPSTWTSTRRATGLTEAISMDTGTMGITRIPPGPSGTDGPGRIPDSLRPEKERFPWSLGSSKDSERTEMEKAYRATLEERVNTVNELLKKVDLAGAPDSTKQYEELFAMEADLKTAESELAGVNYIQRKLDENAYKSPTVAFGVGDSPQSVIKSHKWQSLASNFIARATLNVIKAKKDKETGSKVVQENILKNVLAFEILELRKPSDALQWIFSVKSHIASDPAVAQAMAGNSFYETLKTKLCLASDKLMVATCSSTGDLLAALDQKYLSTGYGVDLVFTYVLLKLPKVQDQRADRQNAQMLSNCAEYLKQSTYFQGLGVWEKVKQDQISQLEDLLFDTQFYNFFLNVWNKYAAADDAKRRDMVNKPRFELEDVSNLNDSYIPAASKSILENPPLYMRATTSLPAITLAPVQSNSVSAPEAARLLVVMCSTCAHSSNEKDLRDKIRDLGKPGGSGRSGGWKNKSNMPVQNTELDDPDEEDIEAHNTVVRPKAPASGGNTKKPKLPRRKCVLTDLLGCSHGHTGLGCARWCPNFRDKSLTEKLDIVKKANLCKVCLLKAHAPGVQCGAKVKCYHCKSPDHNTSLHAGDKPNIPLNNTEVAEVANQEDEDLSVYLTEAALEGEDEETETISLNHLDVEETGMETEDVEVVAINLTHLGDTVEAGPGNCDDIFFFNKIRGDREAVELLDKLVANASAKLEPVCLELDSWDHDYRELLCVRKIDDLRSAVLDAKKRRVEGPSGDNEKAPDAGGQGEDTVEDVANTELFASLIAGAKVEPKHLEQNLIKFSRDGTGSGSHPKLPQEGEMPSQELIRKIMRSNSDFVHCSNIKTSENKVSFQQLDPDYFKRVTDIMDVISKVATSRLLHFTEVDLLIPNPTQERVALISKLPDVVIFLSEQGPCARVSGLLDPGSSTNLCINSLTKLLEPPKLAKIRARIVTVAGTSTLDDYKYKLTLRVYGDRVHNMSAVKIKKISQTRQLSPFEKATLDHGLGLTEDLSEYFNIPTSDKVTYLLLGQEESSLHSVRVLDPRDLGLNFNIFSPRLKVHCDLFSAGRMFSLSGAFGYPASLRSPAGSPHVCPVITIPREMNKKEELEKLLNKHQELLQSSDAWLNSSSLVQMEERMETNALEYENSVATIPDTDLTEYMNNVLVTQCDARAVEHYLNGEKALLIPYLPCREHEKMRMNEIKNCKSCASRNISSSKLDHEKRYSELWSKVSLVEGKDGKKHIEVNLPFACPTKDIGQLHHSNLIAALAATKRLYTQCVKEGSLSVIDNQFRNRIAKGWLEPLQEKEIEDIKTGKLHSQFVLRNKASVIRNFISKLFLLCLKVANLKSESTPTRLIANTSRAIDYTDAATLSASDWCPRFGEGGRAPTTEIFKQQFSDLIELLAISLKTFVSPILLQADIKSGNVNQEKIFSLTIVFNPQAYLNMKLSEATSYLFLNCWYLAPHKYGTKYPLLLKSKCIDFGKRENNNKLLSSHYLSKLPKGFGSASVLLRISILKYGSVLCTLELSVRIMHESIYVDNISVDLATSVKIAADVLDDIVAALNSIGMPVDKFYIPETIYNDPDFQEVKRKYNIVFKEKTTTLGFEWNLRCIIYKLTFFGNAVKLFRDDTIIPCTHLTLWPANRGVPTGPSLKKQSIETIFLTRRHITRVSAQLWDNTGRCWAIGQAQCKFYLRLLQLLSHGYLSCYLRKSCGLMSVNEMDRPICEKDPELAMSATRFFKDCADGVLKPFPRTTVKPGWKIVSLVQDHDASAMLVGTALYVVTESEDGTRESHIVAAKSLLSEATIPANESRGHLLASKLLSVFLHAVSPVLSAYGWKFQCTILTDNLSSTHLYREAAKAVLLRNIRQHVLENTVTLLTLVPGMDIVWAWCPSKHISSDLLTKQLNTPICDVINGDKWRFGDSLFKQFELLHYFWYMKTSSGDILYRQLPKMSKIDPRMDFHEVVSENPIQEGDSYEVKFDKDLNILNEKIPNKDKPVDLNHIMEDILNDTAQEQTIHNFQAAAELEQLSGCHDDEYNTLFVTKYSNLLQEASEYEEPNQVDWLDEVKKELLTWWTGAVMTRRMRTSASATQKLPGPVSGHRSLNSDNKVSLDEAGWRDAIPSVTLKSFQKREELSDTISCVLRHKDTQALSKDLYDLLLNRTFNVLSILNTLIKMLKLKHKQADTALLSELAWSKLVVSDQSYYKPNLGRLKNNVWRHGNFLVITLRAHGLVLPLLASDSPLLERTIETLHLQPTGFRKFPDAHISLQTLRRRVMASQFAVWSPNIDGTIKRKISRCPGCCRTLLKRFIAPAGERYTKVQPAKCCLSDISIDPIGPVNLRNHTNARRATLQCFILVIGCQHTGAIILTVAGAVTSDAIILALKSSEMSYNKSFERIYADAGTSLSAALLQSKHRNWTVSQHPGNAHHRVYVESRIKSVKVIFNTFMKKYSRENRITVPITIFELCFLCSTIQNQINNIPYSSLSGACPNWFLTGGRGLEQQVQMKPLLEADSQDKSDRVMAKFQTWLEDMTECREQLLGQVLSDKSTLADVGNCFFPLQGDICLALSGSGHTSDVVLVLGPGDKDYDPAKIRKDNKDTFSDRTCAVRTTSGKVKALSHTALRLISAGSIRKEKEKTTNKPF